MKNITNWTGNLEQYSSSKEENTNMNVKRIIHSTIMKNSHTFGHILYHKMTHLHLLPGIEKKQKPLLVAGTAGTSIHLGLYSGLFIRQQRYSHISIQISIDFDHSRQVFGFQDIHYEVPTFAAKTLGNPSNLQTRPRAPTCRILGRYKDTPSRWSSPSRWERRMSLSRRCRTIEPVWWLQEPLLLLQSFLIYLVHKRNFRYFGKDFYYCMDENGPHFQYGLPHWSPNKYSFFYFSS